MHHVVGWPGWTMVFGDAKWTVWLSFSRCTPTPEHTLVAHVELEGHTYDAMKKRKNVEFPLREALVLSPGADTLWPDALSPDFIHPNTN